VLDMAKELVLHLPNRDIDYLVFGKGKKSLIMIQGLNTRGIKGAAYSLAYMYRMFAKEYTVYVFDRRPDVFEGITIRDFALDVAEAMDALGIKNADVLGVSQGGMIAQYLAIERPDLVNKMVLAVTLSENNDTVESVIHRWIQMVQTDSMKEFIVDMAEKMYSDAYVKRYRLFFPLLAILQKPKDAKRFIILAKSCLTCNTYELLAKIQCPVFVIGGKQDKIVTGEASIQLANKLGCKLYMYENLGHAAYEEAKDFNQIVYDFVVK